MVLASFLLALLGQSQSKVDLSPLEKSAIEMIGYLGDPRGAQYRRVIVKGQTPYPPGVHAMELVGFVHPNHPESVILWDGLTYPLEKDLGPADLKAAVALAKKAEFAASPGSSLVAFGPQKPRYGFEVAIVNPAAAALFALLGEEQAATRLVDKLKLSDENKLAGWLASRYRMRFFDVYRAGDDRAAKAALEKEAALSKRYDVRQSVARANTVEELTAEVERRLQPSTNQDSSLLTDLQDVRTLPSYGWDLDPILKKVIEKGPEIVPDLIKASAQDTRLTRSSVPSRNFPDASIATVRQAAQVAILNIWPESTYFTQAPADLLKRFNRQRDMSHAERLVDIAEDPDAPHYAASFALNALASSPNEPKPRQLEARLAVPRLLPRIEAAVRRRFEELDRAYKRNPTDSDLGQMNVLSLAFAELDYDRARTMFKTSVERTFEVVKNPPPGFGNSTKDILSMFALASAHDDYEIQTIYIDYVDLPNKIQEFPYLLSPAVRSPKAQLSQSVLVKICREAEEIAGDKGNPGRAIRLCMSLFDTDTAFFLQSDEIRSVLAAALKNESAVMATATGEGWELPLDWGSPRHVQSKDGIKGQLLVSVADYVSFKLSEEFDTGADFQFAEFPTRKAERIEAAIRWLHSLKGEKPERKDILRMRGKLVRASSKSVSRKKDMYL